MIKIATVYVKDGNLEQALKLFKRKTQQEGLIKEYRERQYYKSNSEKRKEAKKAGRRKQLKKMRKEEAYYKRMGM